jgi:hypothetical protein
MVVSTFHIFGLTHMIYLHQNVPTISQEIRSPYLFQIYVMFNSSLISSWTLSSLFLFLEFRNILVTSSKLFILTL